MSDMYRKEVPLYGELLDLVKDVNEPLLGSLTPAEVSRLTQERHGAIRVGKESELRNLARLFKLLGMHAVGYYDLTTAGLPVHATAFRATDASLLENPFRIFTSLLRQDLIADEDTRALARATLAAREIFSSRSLELIAEAEAAGGVSESVADEFISSALCTFAFDRSSTVSEEQYTQLAAASPLVADIVSFGNPHINHLTPCCLDIDVVQSSMISRGIPPKSIIEGPPPRLCPILLRQTSFTAIEEPIIFADEQSVHSGHHKARFGEIESRGAALTKKGRALFDELFRKARETEVETSTAPHGDHSANAIHQEHLQRFFRRGFPDDWETLRKRGLIYVRYEVVSPTTEPKTLDELIAEGRVAFKGVLYEDFLPASAAGIFTSNLGRSNSSHSEGRPDQEAFERALGYSVLDSDTIYRRTQEASLLKVHKAFPGLVL